MTSSKDIRALMYEKEILDCNFTKIVISVLLLEVSSILQINYSKACNV